MLKCNDCEALLPITYKSCPKCGNNELARHVSVAFKREKIREDEEIKVTDSAFVINSRTKLD